MVRAEFLLHGTSIKPPHSACRPPSPPISGAKRFSATLILILVLILI